MSRDRAMELMMDSLMGSLDEAERAELAAYRADESLRGELDELEELWGRLSSLEAPEASGSGAARFVRALGDELDRGSTGSAARRRARRPAALRAAAMIVLVVGAGMAGGVIGRATAPAVPPQPEGPRFLLLIRGGTPADPGAQERLVGDFASWARDLAGEGRLLAAEKLEDGPGVSVGAVAVAGAARAADGADLSVGGFFVVSAADLDEARAIAEAAPHLGFGGGVEVRPIDDAARR